MLPATVGNDPTRDEAAPSLPQREGTVPVPGASDRVIHQTPSPSKPVRLSELGKARARRKVSDRHDDQALGRPKMSSVIPEPEPTQAGSAASQLATNSPPDPGASSVLVVEHLSKRFALGRLP